MRTVKAKLILDDEETVMIPIIIPDVAEVKAFADQLHAKGRAWQGEVFGWEAAYEPERAQAPLDSKMTFMPADFWIGQSDIWFYSLMWENGKDNRPVEYLDERHILALFDINEPMLNLIPSTS